MLDVVGDMARILTTLLAALIAWLVYSYNRKKDKQEYFRLANAEMHELNKPVLSNEQNLAVADQLISGTIQPYHEMDARKRFLSFMILNRIENIWVAQKSGLIDKEIADYEIEAMAYIVRNNEKLFKDALSQGYSREFVKVISGYFSLR